MGLTSKGLKASPGERAPALAAPDASAALTGGRAPDIMLLNSLALIRSADPFVVEKDVPCEECAGSGRDIGSVDPWDGDVCSNCAGSGRQTVIRNYLAEAFQIAANPESTRPVERQHLVAVIQHCREVVTALMSLPEVA